MTAAAISTVLGVLPVFLLGGLAVLVRADLGFGEVKLGLAISVCFSVAALVSAWIRRRAFSGDVILVRALCPCHGRGWSAGLSGSST